MAARSKALIAGVAMTGWYFGILTLLGGGGSFAWSQFSQYWYLVVPIIATFAGHVYLAAKSTWVTGPTSAISMAACCAHHIADLVPLVGLVSAASFLTKYQLLLMVVALVFNLAVLGYTYFHK